MTRKVDLKTQARNLNWTLHLNDDGTWDCDRIQIALLADIREELVRLNAVLHCTNFLAIPRKLDRISRNTAKKRKPRVVGKPKLRVVR